MRTICLYFFLAAAALAQDIQVSGRVLDSNGKPIEAARVRLAFQRETPVDATTNAQGAFTIEAPARSYNFSVNKDGFLPYTEQIAASRSSLNIRLVPASSISGRVLDSDGKPAPKASVTAYRYAYVRGARSLDPAGYSVIADENGAYAFPGLTAGRYYLRVESKDGSVTTYYPSTLDPAAAAAVDVDTGATRSGVDIRQRKEQLFVVRGKAVMANGEPATSAVLTILPEQPIETQTPPPRVQTIAEGSFEFKDLLPGRYTIRATPNGNVVTPDRQMFPAKGAGRMDVNITRENIEDLKFTLGDGYTLAGRVRTEDGSALPIPQPPPAPAKPLPQGVPDVTAGLRVSLTDAEQMYTPGNLMAPIAPDGGAFRIEKIVPGRYYVRVNPLPPNVYIQSVRYGGQDITRSTIDLTYGGGDNLEIVLGTKAGTVSATVRNSKGEAMPRVQVALWPDKLDLGTYNSSIRVAVSDDNGAVRFTSLRPEKYRLAAFAEAEQAFVRSPDYLDRFRSRAAELDVSENASLERTLEPVSREDALAAIRNLQ